MASALQEIFDEIKRKAALQPRLKTESHDIAMKGMEYAAEISPVLTGDFKDSWVVVDLPPRFDGDTPASQLKNTDDGAVSIEYGTKDTPPHGTLASTKTYMELLASTEKHI